VKPELLYTATQLIDQGAASTHVAVQALVEAGDLHPQGTGHARYPAHEVVRLAEMLDLDIDEPAVIIKLGPWQSENGTVFAGRSGYGFRSGLRTTELADSCRGVWRIDPARFFRAGLLIPVHIGITRGAFRIMGSGPIPVEDRWAVEVEPLEDSDRELAERILDRRVSLPGRNPVRFLNGA
jgi:hypothetical protein